MIISTVQQQKTEVWRVLSGIMDPELGCSIVELGLVYGVVVEGGSVKVRMTLTSPACPMGDLLPGGVQAALMAVDWVEAAVVELVFDPPWHPSMSQSGRADLN